MTLLLVLGFGALLSSAAMTGLVRRYALKRQVVDRPSDRGLHDRNVPRGGGAAIVMVVSAALALLAHYGVIDTRLGLLWLVCGLGFGLLGWIDDHLDLRAVFRFACQVALATVFCVPVLTSAARFTLGSLEVDAWLLVPIGVVAMTWGVNLYNFMDGSDGFAATESILVAVAGAAIVWTTTPDAALIAILVASATAGFLVWNWQPARIFMGDVGSYFLGFQFAALTLHGALSTTGAWIWLILLAPFVTDSSLTLLRRMLNAEKWWRAHRTHAYQRLILSGWTHARVCLALAAMTILVLMPIAVAAAHYPSWALGATVAAYLLTVIIWVAIINKTTRRVILDRGNQ